MGSLRVLPEPENDNNVTGQLRYVLLCRVMIPYYCCYYYCYTHATETILSLYVCETRNMFSFYQHIRYYCCFFLLLLSGFALLAKSLRFGVQSFYGNNNFVIV